MEIEGVDPRTGTWEREPDAYRVYFWKRGRAPEHVRPERVGYVSYEHELRGAKDVEEVIAWANEHAGEGRTYTLYAVLRDGNERGLIHLLGVDPTRSYPLPAD